MSIAWWAVSSSIQCVSLDFPDFVMCTEIKATELTRGKVLKLKKLASVAFISEEKKSLVRRA